MKEKYLMVFAVFLLFIIGCASHQLENMGTVESIQETTDETIDIKSEIKVETSLISPKEAERNYYVEKKKIRMAYVDALNQLLKEGTLPDGTDVQVPKESVYFDIKDVNEDEKIDLIIESLIGTDEYGSYWNSKYVIQYEPASDSYRVESFGDKIPNEETMLFDLRKLSKESISLFEENESFENTWEYIQKNGVFEEKDYSKLNWDSKLEGETFSKTEKVTKGIYCTNFKVGYIVHDLLDCGDYYQAEVILYREAKLASHPEIGGSTYYIDNEITGHKQEITRLDWNMKMDDYGRDEFYEGDETLSAYSYKDNLYDAYTSYCYYIPCYRGTLRIRKDALNCNVFVSFGDIELFKEIHYSNMILFDEEGYVNAFLFVDSKVEN